MTATARARRRQVVPGQRRNKVRVTLTDQELAAFRAAAAAEGLAVAAWLARAGADLAGGLSVPASRELRSAVAELGAAARYARNIGLLLNQAVAALHSTGAPGPALAPAARLSQKALARLDAAAVAVTEALP